MYHKLLECCLGFLLRETRVKLQVIFPDSFLLSDNYIDIRWTIK